MHVLHSIRMFFSRAHTNLEDGWRCVLLPPQHTHPSDLISPYSPLCSSPQPAKWPHCYSLNMPNTPLPQGLCTCYSFSIEHSFPRIPAISTLLPVSDLLKCHLFRELSPNAILFIITSCSSAFRPPLSLYNTYHPLTYILLIYLHIVLYAYLHIEHTLREGMDCFFLNWYSYLKYRRMLLCISVVVVVCWLP